jgi:hypothetical protein
VTPRLVALLPPRGNLIGTRATEDALAGIDSAALGLCSKQGG